MPKPKSRYVMATLLCASSFWLSCRPAEVVIVGKWVEFNDYALTSDTIEFFEDQTCIINEEGSALSGKWILLQDGRVKIEFSLIGVPTVFIGPLSGDVLRLQQPSSIWVTRWVREGSAMAERVRSAFEHDDLANEGMSQYYNQEFEAAIETLTQAAEAGNPRAQMGLGWLYATVPDNRYQNGNKAIRYAKQAIEWNDQVWSNWNTLAAAHMRAEDFQSAVAAGEEALRLATLYDNTDGLDRMGTWMPLYKSRKQFVIQEGKLVIE